MTDTAVKETPPGITPAKGNPAVKTVVTTTDGDQTQVTQGQQGKDDAVKLDENGEPIEPSKPNPFIPREVHTQRVDKWRTQAKAAQAQNTDYERLLQAKELEIEMLKQNQQVPGNAGGQMATVHPIGGTLKVPDPLAYDNNADYTTAMDQYVSAATQQQVQAALQEHTQTVTQAQHEQLAAQQFEQQREKHYARAVTYENFDACEDAAIAVLGVNVAQTIIGAFPENSEQILYALGNDVEKAQHFKQMFSSMQTAPRGMVELTDYGRGLASPNLTQTPEPDAPLNGGGSGNVSWDQRMTNALSQYTGGKMAMKDYHELKRDALKAGWREK